MKVLDLFSGIGGFSLGLERAGMETAAFCEIEEYPRRVLGKHWPGIPVFRDIRTLTAEKLKQHGIENIRLICGGYPCQPFSLPGLRNGETDDRHLWPEMYRLVREIRPRWVLAENVAGHVSMGLDSVLFDLEDAGYRAWTFVIPACAVDARHRRDRVWIIAHDHNGALRQQQITERRGQDSPLAADNGEKGAMADAEGVNLRPGFQQSEQGEVRRGRLGDSGRSDVLADLLIERLQGYAWHGPGGKESGRNGAETDGSACSSGVFRGITAGGGFNWCTEPGMGRVAHGVSDRVDRIKGLGNAVVPQIPEVIGRVIMEIENEKRKASED